MYYFKAGKCTFAPSTTFLPNSPISPTPTNLANLTHLDYRSTLSHSTLRFVTEGIKMGTIGYALPVVPTSDLLPL